MGAILTLYFLATISFLSGAIIVITASGDGKRTGWYLLIIALFLGILGLLIYSAAFGDKGYGDV